MTDDKEPIAPQPERGKQGEEGEEGTDEGQGGAGGHGGRGGRGGIGIPGDKGDTGARGMRGPSGGERGATGETGAAGRAGPTGDTGIRGDRGDMGDRGDTGGRGDIGQTGQIGDRGMIGDTGTQGVQGRRGAQGEPGNRTPMTTKIALFIAVGATALSALFFSTKAARDIDNVQEARAQLADEQAVFEERQARFAANFSCEHRVFTATLDALKARSTFAEQQAEVTLAGDTAQRDYLAALLDPETGDAEAVRLSNKYLQALDVKIQATEEQLTIRDLNPYPTDEQISRCLD